MSPSATAAGITEMSECSCCGRKFTETRIVRLLCHPAIGLCFGCARWLHGQARQQADAERSTVAARIRDVARLPRRVVIDHGWHNRPVIGRVLRWLGGEH